MQCYIIVLKSVFNKGMGDNGECVLRLTKGMSTNAGTIRNLHGKIGNIAVLQVLQNGRVCTAHIGFTQVLVCCKVYLLVTKTHTQAKPDI